MINIVKLKNNTEVIGSTVSIDEERVVLENPFTINYMISPDSDRPIVGLLRFMQFAEDFRTTFRREDIMTVAIARNSMADYYKDVLKTYEKEIDDSVDKELRRVVAERGLEETEADNSVDVLSAMLDKIKNNNLH